MVLSCRSEGAGESFHLFNRASYYPAAMLVVTIPSCGGMRTGKDIMNTFDPESLSKNNGKDGRPVFVAHKGRIIDVSASKLWKTGIHMNRHPAGHDLTADIEAAPHGPEVLDRYPQVGTLATTDGADRSLPESLERLLERFPVLRRHPHPMVVHFPIVFAISPVLFYLLYGITGRWRSRPLRSIAWGPASSFVCRPY